MSSYALDLYYKFFQHFELPDTVERSFSTLQKLTNWLRTMMKEDCHVSLALMNIHCKLTDSLSAEKNPENLQKIKIENLIFFCTRIQYTTPF